MSIPRKGWDPFFSPRLDLPTQHSQTIWKFLSAFTLRDDRQSFSDRVLTVGNEDIAATIESADGHAEILSFPFLSLGPAKGELNHCAGGQFCRRQVGKEQVR
jgi:hypothetical protein